MQLQAQRNLGSQQRVWRSERLAFGRTISRHLPEDQYDLGPVTIDGDKYALVADARLDNRAELVRALGLSAELSKQSCDAAILALCLLAWGRSAMHRLVGDFAFAWWDRRAATLVLATDFMGQRPLHYAAGKGYFAFASMPRGLHALDRIPRRPSLTAALGFMQDHGQASFFENLTLLPPGHLLTVREDRLEQEKWWQFAGEPACGRFDDAVGQARALLDQAVARRLRRNGVSIASHLSGGLDSSGVSATAALLLETDEVTAFTAIPWGTGLDTPHGTIADESKLASAVAERYGNVVHVKVPSDGSLQDVFERDLMLWERPVPNPFNDMWWSKISKAADARGARILLTAPMGNIGLSHSGAELISQLWASGRLWSLGKLLRDHRRDGLARWGELAKLVARESLPSGAANAIRKLRGQSGPNPFLVAGVAPTPTRAIAREEQGSLGHRLEIIGNSSPGNFHSGAIAGWNVDMRDALADKNLIEFTLGLPAEVFFQNGWPRSLARQVLADRLPKAVTEERRKGLQAADWYLSVIKEREFLIAEAEAIADSPAAEIIDGHTIRRALIELPQSGWASHAVRRKYGSQLITAVQAGHFIRGTSGY